jgi:hypothetical protein
MFKKSVELLYYVGTISALAIWFQSGFVDRVISWIHITEPEIAAVEMRLQVHMYVPSDRFFLKLDIFHPAIEASLEQDKSSKRVTLSQWDHSIKAHFKSDADFRVIASNFLSKLNLSQTIRRNCDCRRW